MVRISAYLIIFIGLLVSPGLAEEPRNLQPHRAYYTLSMAGHPTPQSSIVDVRGTMMLEFNKVCGGWTVQQLTEVRRYYDDSSVQHMRWGYVMLEADDASHFSFNTFRKIDDELVEKIVGVAKQKGKLVEVIFQKPEKMTVTLPEGVLFPIHHTKALLEAAQNGEHIFPCIVFDGSSIEGASEINAFIGAKKVLESNSTSEAAHQLANQPFWPVRFAVYGMGEADYEPDYTTTQDLLPNGIIKQYVIDNGEIKIRGVLDRIELLNEGGC